jgi:hypothetical protein
VALEDVDEDLAATGLQGVLAQLDDTGHGASVPADWPSVKIQWYANR